ncbi:MAG: ATP phosphoribosyltransferase [Thermodesulfobacteriota bacterium]
MSGGRLLIEAVKLFRKAGIDISGVKKDPRKLIFDFKDLDLRILITRPTDVPSYVEYGAADCGVVGKDTLIETNANLYEPLDLKIGKCRLVVAAPDGFDPRGLTTIKVATKYPKIAYDHYIKKGISVEVLKLYGSIELAPLAGLSDVIIDLSASGKTLKTNKLKEIETIEEITARFVVNKVSFKVKSKEILELIKKLKKARGA